MTTLTNGFMTFANGVYAMVHNAASPVTIAAVIAAVSLAWIARIEVDEYDRRGHKPIVRHH